MKKDSIKFSSDFYRSEMRTAQISPGPPRLNKQYDVTSVYFTVNMTDMASLRIFKNPRKSFLLLGPRATGKSTWLHNQIKPDLVVDLLKSRDFQNYSTNLDLLRQKIEAAPSKIKIVVVDEVQKLPELLDEVHSLIFEFKHKVQFILTGSSARKLKKKQVNLLAGRALVRYFHPFSLTEIKEKFDIKKALEFGMLPEVWNLRTDDEKKDYLSAYVDTYLKEEIKQEAAVRSLPSYLYFLEHLALRNAQVLNIQNISQETGVARTTLNGYLDVLEETMLGCRVLPIHLRAKVKEVSTPKFYFFDTGVVRTLSKKLDSTFNDEKGFLLETYVLHEIKVHSDYFQKRIEVFYWGTASDNEVDFILVKGDKKIGVEVKSSKKWNKKFNSGLNTLLETQKINKAYGVYLGSDSLKVGEVHVLPVEKFIDKLFADQIV